MLRPQRLDRSAANAVPHERHQVRPGGVPPPAGQRPPGQLRVETLPEWLQWVAANQPVTPIIETIRALLMREPVGDTLWWALGWCLVILAAAAVAVVLIAWARSSGKLPAFFDDIIDQVAGSA